ncbi:hypothetical protein Q9233_005131 [Columba guinea]|nr:hypothetical protein Q9233_005131 [Columba guinea]
MLQTVCTSPELLVNQNTSENEISVYSPAQGSPLPGETASPKSYCQQSPALPDSGLTEFNVASPKIHPSPSCKPQEMSAPTDSGLSSGPPQKCYMGVRVKMPVRELLRKIRLSKGLDPAHSKQREEFTLIQRNSLDRLLHKAVAQGRRALTYALAQRFASLNKIDEKDAEKRVFKNCKTNGICVEVNLTDHYGLTPLHCAALAHTVLATESQKTDIDTDLGRFLRLRKDQILEGINCLLQMGGKPELQVLNSRHINNTCLKIEENRELMCLLQTHKPKTHKQNILQEVCTVPRDYQGYDKVLGLCICQTDSLETVCNSQCRRQQRDTLQVTCTGKAAQLFIAYRNGNKTAVSLGELRTVLLRPYFSLKDICTSEQGKDTHPTYIVEMSVKSDHGERGSSWVQSLSPSNSTSKLMVTGILNPTVCINVNVIIMFIVSKEHYPVYDVNNLYNTNAEFDWGDFRSLREEVNQASQKLLFFFQFRYAGTYVLRLGSNPHKKMVGIAKKPGLLLKPDWTAVTGVITGLLALLIASVLSTVKTMYQELTGEISSMKDLWMKTLNIPDETGACDTYLNPKQQVELSSATIAHGKTKEILSSLFS